jgi:hypothetical protein
LVLLRLLPSMLVKRLMTMLASCELGALVGWRPEN